MRIRTLSVTEVNRYIGRIVEGDPILSALSVRGEVSNFKVYASGHAYFSLKDDGGKLPCVMFKNAFSQVNFLPDEGTQVIARGHMAVYERDGRYQLMVHHLEQEGEGTLYLAFLKLKQALQVKGYFDSELKKSLPLVRRIGVVTSPDGAAIKDFLSVLKRRNPLIEVAIYPSRVQGQEAIAEIVQGIGYFNATKAVDAIVITRGGGSIEELWAFNEEKVADAIFQSTLPVISAVGHETDTTIADYVADLRAPTPSAAAEMIALPLKNYYQDLERLKQDMAKRLQQKGTMARLMLESQNPDKLASRIENRIAQQRQYLDHYFNRMATHISYRIETARKEIKHLERTLVLHHPQGILDKGYVLVKNDLGKVLTSASDIKLKKSYELQFKDGTVTIKRSSQ